MTEKEHAEDITDLAAEIKRLNEALRIAGSNIIVIQEHNRRLNAALETGCMLIDHLMADLRVAGGDPTPGLLAAKSSFDFAMRQLLGERIFSKIGKPIPPAEKPN